MNKLYFTEKKNKTHVAIVLDKSGSMFSIYKETLNGYNEQVEAIKENIQPTDDYRVTLVTFDTTVQEQYFNQPMETLREFTEKDYTLGAYTALRDAVGYTIDKVEDVVDEETAVLLIIITDGHENASKRVSSSRLAEKIQSLTTGKDARWTISYVGPNTVDLTKICEEYKIPMGNTYTYNVDPQGTEVMFSAMADSTVGYMRERRTGTMAMDNFNGGTTDTATSVPEGTAVEDTDDSDG